MKCDYCGWEGKGNICPNCGKSLYEENDYSNQQVHSVQGYSAAITPAGKGTKKRVGVIVLCVTAVIVIGALVFFMFFRNSFKNSNSSEDSLSSNETTYETTSEPSLQDNSIKKNNSESKIIEKQEGTVEKKDTETAVDAQIGKQMTSVLPTENGTIMPPNPNSPKKPNSSSSGEVTNNTDNSFTNQTDSGTESHGNSNPPETPDPPYSEDMGMYYNSSGCYSLDNLEFEYYGIFYDIDDSLYWYKDTGWELYDDLDNLHPLNLEKNLKAFDDIFEVYAVHHETGRIIILLIWNCYDHPVKCGDISPCVIYMYSDYYIYERDNIYLPNINLDCAYYNDFSDRDCRHQGYDRFGNNLRIYEVNPKSSVRILGQSFNLGRAYGIQICPDGMVDGIAYFQMPLIFKYNSISDFVYYEIAN